MYRERKLLYTAVILAVLQNAMLLADVEINSGQPTRQALIEEDKACQARLLRVLYAYRSQMQHCPGKGI